MRCSLSLSHIHTYRNLFVTVCSFFCLPRAQPPRQLRRVDDGEKKSSLFRLSSLPLSSPDGGSNSAHAGREERHPHPNGEKFSNQDSQRFFR